MKRSPIHRQDVKVHQISDPTGTFQEIQVLLLRNSSLATNAFMNTLVLPTSMSRDSFSFK